jgi:hypothetical protein
MKKTILLFSILFLSLSSIFSLDATNKGLVLDSNSVNLYTEIEEKGMSFRAKATPWHTYEFGGAAKKSIDLSKLPSVLQIVTDLGIVGTGTVGKDAIVSIIYRVTPFTRTIKSTSESVVNQTTVYPKMEVTSHYSTFPYIAYPVTSHFGYKEYIYTFTITKGDYSNNIELMEYILKWNGSEQFSSGKYLSVITINYRRDN